MRLAASVVAIFALFALVSFGFCAPKTNCIKNTNACVRSAECCTGCCHDDKCVDFSDSCLSDKLSGAIGPCALLDPPCPSGHECVVQPVQCVANPCPPVAACLPPDYLDYD